MQLYFLTSVGWSLDANGNLQALNTAGTILAKFSSGNLSTGINKSVNQTNSQIFATTSAISVSMGIGAIITPKVSGTVFIVFSADATPNTVGGRIGIMAAQGSTVPAGGGGASDTINNYADLASDNNSFCITAGYINVVNILGGTLGVTSYVFYGFAFSAGSPTAFNWKNANIWGFEI